MEIIVVMLGTLYPKYIIYYIKFFILLRRRETYPAHLIDTITNSLREIHCITFILCYIIIIKAGIDVGVSKTVRMTL